jgi:hypothetical protein
LSDEHDISKPTIGLNLDISARPSFLPQTALHMCVHRPCAWALCMVCARGALWKCPLARSSHMAPMHVAFELPSGRYQPCLILSMSLFDHSHPILPSSLFLARTPSTLESEASTSLPCPINLTRDRVQHRATHVYSLVEGL